MLQNSMNLNRNISPSICMWLVFIRIISFVFSEFLHSNRNLKSEKWNKRYKWIFQRSSCLPLKWRKWVQNEVFLSLWEVIQNERHYNSLLSYPNPLSRKIIVQHLIPPEIQFLSPPLEKLSVGPPLKLGTTLKFFSAPLFFLPVSTNKNSRSL